MCLRFVGCALASALLACVALAADPTPDAFLRQSRGAGHPEDIDAWRQGEQREGLKPYPPAPPGAPNPAGGLFQFGGGGRTSFAGPDLGMPFTEWQAKMQAQRAAVDAAARALLEARFTLDCKTD